MMENLKNQQDQSKVVVPLSLSVIVTDRNDNPCIELRRVIMDMEVIKTIVSCAFHGKSIIVTPKFNDSLRSLNSLIQKGILYKKGDEFFFTI